MAVRSTLRAGRPLPPEIFLVLISLKGWVGSRDIERPKGLGQLKNPMISRNEPATIRLVAQCLNQQSYRVTLPPKYYLKADKPGVRVMKAVEKEVKCPVSLNYWAHIDYILATYTKFRGVIQFASKLSNTISGL
jgi:hypothetical protein